MWEKLDVLIEEHSMEVTLESLLPKIIGDIEFKIHPFQCKDDLLKKLPVRLRGYASCLPDRWGILVLVDRDNDQCAALKRQLEDIARRVGLLSKTAAEKGQYFQLINRIAIEELESWFFGDWDAVRAAYPKVPITIPQKEGFRDPDAIAGGTWEALERILKKAGYFSAGLRKAVFAEAVAPHMAPERNRSSSFQALRQALELATGR